MPGGLIGLAHRPDISGGRNFLVGMQKGKPAVEQLFKTEWPITTWEEVLAQ